jgi:PAS domain S-box-containing protein
MYNESELTKPTVDELYQSQERFRAAFESSAIGMGLLALDGKILQVNDAVLKMSGYTKDELFQRYDHENVYPEDRDVGADLFQELLAGKRNWFQVEKRYVRKDGDVFWVRLTLSAAYDPQGNIAYLVELIDDIDAQKKALESLHESEARFEAIFDNVAVGVAVMGLNRRPIAFNATAEQIIGYSFDEVKDMDPRMLALPEDRGIDAGLFEELIEGKRNSYVMERRYRHKDESVFWARINYSLVRDLDGRPDYLVGIIEDIDDQKRASERLAEQEADYLRMLQQRVDERTQELEEANQLLQQEIEQRTKIEQELAERAADEAVTADRTRLARDLHDAVTQILFSASLTAEVLPELWETDVEEAKRSTEELRQLTRGALAEMRTLLLELRPAALTQARLGDLIRQLCEAMIGRSRLPIDLIVEGDRTLPPEVQVAFYRIAQESLNNISKYARATKINVGLFMSPAGAHFNICDNGAGFDMSTKKATSLGLRIMRERAEAIGAQLTISSEPGKGTCVEVEWVEKPNMKLSVFKKTERDIS